MNTLKNKGRPFGNYTEGSRTISSVLKDGGGQGKKGGSRGYAEKMLKKRRLNIRMSEREKEKL